MPVREWHVPDITSDAPDVGVTSQQFVNGGLRVVGAV
jgi:hypothetical protein